MHFQELSSPASSHSIFQRSKNFVTLLPSNFRMCDCSGHGIALKTQTLIIGGVPSPRLLLLAVLVFDISVILLINELIELFTDFT